MAEQVAAILERIVAWSNLSVKMDKESKYFKNLQHVTTFMAEQAAAILVKVMISLNRIVKMDKESKIVIDFSTCLQRF